MTKYWFKPKTYGYGVTPISVEGWLVTLLLIIFVLLAAYSNNLFLYPTLQEIIKFVIDAGIIISLFILFSKEKMNGKMEWRWGKKKWF